MIFYVHGFASSAKSTKAGYFAERFREHGVPFQCPDFNEPDFATMTLTRMLQQLGTEIERAVGGVRLQPDHSSSPVTLIGSSLGGALAILAAAKFPTKVERVVLLAPAVMFSKPGHHLLPPERIEEWRRRGALPFFHYGYNEERMLNYTFHEDSMRHDAFHAPFEQPTLIFQGLRDASVDHRPVEAFARARPNVTLSLLEDDHQLIASLPRIWEGTADFLGLAR